MGVNADFWAGRRVLLTGHTGFKGAWLAVWLQQMGADLHGLALPPEGAPNLWQELGGTGLREIQGDIRDLDLVQQTFRDVQPEIVLHLAAQSLVRRSYREPVDTFATNVMGTVNLLEASRQVSDLKAFVSVTSDKCYRNEETAQAFVESDAMGGHDPYSASKGAAEIVTAAMRASFFEGGAGIASARAGNVIGGGDWSEDRLVPDIIRDCLTGDGKVIIRSPNAVRPWQHVLEPLAGYLMLAEALFEKRDGAASGWNFGPNVDQERPVKDLTAGLIARLGQGEMVLDPTAADLHEAQILRLDSTKARTLGWAPCLTFDQTLDLVADWYRAFAEGAPAAKLCAEQITHFTSLMRTA